MTSSGILLWFSTYKSQTAGLRQSCGLRLLAVARWAKTSMT